MAANSINSVNPAQVPDSIETSKGSHARPSKIFANGISLAMPTLASYQARKCFELSLDLFCREAAWDSWYAEFRNCENLNMSLPASFNSTHTRLECNLQATDHSFLTITGLAVTGVAISVLMKRILGKERIFIPFETALIVGSSYCAAGAGAPAALALGLGSELIVRMPIVKKAAETTQKFVAEKMKTGIACVAKVNQFFTSTANRLSGQKSQ